MGMGDTYCTGVGCSLRFKCRRHSDEKKKNIEEFGSINLIGGKRCEFFIDTGRKPPVLTFNAEDA